MTEDIETLCSSEDLIEVSEAFREFGERLDNFNLGQSLLTVRIMRTALLQAAEQIRKGSDGP